MFDLNGWNTDRIESVCNYVRFTNVLDRGIRCEDESMCEYWASKLLDVPWSNE